MSKKDLIQIWGADYTWPPPKSQWVPGPREDKELGENPSLPLPTVLKQVSVPVANALPTD